MLSSILIGRYSDYQSPVLTFLTAQGQSVATAKIVLANGALEIALTNVLVGQVGTDSTQNGTPIEKLSLSFRKITWVQIASHRLSWPLRSRCDAAPRAFRARCR